VQAPHGSQGTPLPARPRYLLPRRHNEDDPRLGRALCTDCYDYEAAVLFNAHAGKLWRRFTTYLPRHLARRAGLTQQQLRALVRVRYVKVAEYQERGVVHFHAVIRLDAPGQGYQPPAERFTADLLADAIRDAAAAVRLVQAPDGDHPDCQALVLRFGTQVDPRPVRLGADGLPGTGRKLSVDAVANYIAKYATKSLAATGLPSRPICSRLEIDSLHCSRHYKQMIAAAWRMGARRATGNLRLRKAAHAFGWGGHFLTKSRRYSTTFGHLRRARAEYRKRQRRPDGERDPWGRPLDDTVVLVVKKWTFEGDGYTGTAGEQLALASAARARDKEEVAGAA
jgi:hypothetical protein